MVPTLSLIFTLIGLAVFNPLRRVIGGRQTDRQIDVHRLKPRPFRGAVLHDVDT